MRRFRNTRNARVAIATLRFLRFFVTLPVMKVPEIIFEDNHVLVINKPSGMLVQGDITGDECVLEVMKAFIKKRDSKPGNVFLGLPHRLDRPTSGVLALAKTSKALSRLAASFRERETSKIYWAVVETPPPANAGELTDWLLKDSKTNTSRRVDADVSGAKEARLRYKMLGTSKDSWLLEVELLTGRHHQIRVQLYGMGCSIIGDLKYGARRSGPAGSIHLHARQLIVGHPVQGPKMDLIAESPDSLLWNAFRI